MGERHQEPVSVDPLEDIFEPLLSDLIDEDFEEALPSSSNRNRLAEMRRRAEQRLEQQRLRDELGDYELELNDF
ncbi:MAG: hypothetical protein HOC23_01160 [Halieaceae bacterium]|mgnify:CR=1 FL=1|jgi:hypothetical protein|nr:hypothetical protein [Halieaceae bacterium]